MHLSTLFSTLVGSLPQAKDLNPPPKITPDTQTCAFIVKGHVMEYIQVGPERKKVVSLFFGPQEFVVCCNPQYSILQSLDQVTNNPFTHRQIRHMLRTYAESRTIYMEMRKRYQEKVAERIRTLTTMTGPERFTHLKQHQPWVFKLAAIEDIASYLAIPVEMVKALQKG
ncbi:MAG TPA: hypothetical protein VHC48_19555 [Puia sp.]|nr:hypothetical protein [Puia sp.]